MPQIPLPTPKAGSGGGPILPAGEYNFEIVKCVQKKANSGNTQFEMQLKIGETTVYDYLTFVANAAWRISQCLKCLELFPEDHTDGDALDVEAEWLVGRGGRCVIAIDTYKKGDEVKQKNVVKEYLLDTPDGY